ncbi:MAG TPA: hypothetical protein VE666_13680 [Mycobacterium sp.]|nr:hypothetical protein [Mycobacterium sp.]
MSETPSSSEPATGPVATTEPVAAPPPAEPVAVEAEPRRHNRLTAVAAWVGIVAGVIFIVAVIFFSGFFLGAHSGGHRGWHHGGGDREFGIIHKGRRMFPMGPPRGEFDRPFPPSGPGGPNFQGPQGPGSQQPGGPSTTAPRPS